METQFLTLIISTLLFTISECSCITEEFSETVVFSDVDEEQGLKFGVYNPYGEVTSSVHSGTELFIKGKKKFDPDNPVELSVNLDSDGHYLIEIVTGSASSSSRNSISLVSQICLLLSAAFVSKQGSRNTFIWFIIATGIFVLAAECPAVKLDLSFPDIYTYEIENGDDGYTYFILFPKNRTFHTQLCHNEFGKVVCKPWIYSNNTELECGGNHKGFCPFPKSCELDPYSEVINFTCIDEADRVGIVGGSHGFSFGYPAPKLHEIPYDNVPAFEGESCNGPLEGMGTCRAGYWCNGGVCTPTTKRDGTGGYEVEDKASYYCNSDYPTGSTSWVYYFTVEHWCTLVQNENAGVCQTATEESSIFGGPNMMDGVARETFQINGTIPGPSVYACVGDTIEIHVHNKNMTTGTTIHWHGQWQRFNHYGDGVAQVTQCPIVGAWNGTHVVEGGKWKYVIKAEPAGFTWYHSHTGLQYGDGLFGPITIFQKNREKECSKVDNFWNQEEEGLRWAQWKSNWCDPYQDQYDRHLDGLMIHDWFHNMSSEMYQGVFFGDTNPTNYGINTSFCKAHFKGAGDFQCTHGGPTGDMPYVSGLINGLGQYNGHACGPCADYEDGRAAQAQGSPECGSCQPGYRNGEWNPCHTCGANNYYKVKVPQVGNTYRIGVVNAGQMFALRFSIDNHTMRIIAVDEMYTKPLDVQQIVISPGQRVEFLVNMTQNPDQNYWIRARTFPQQSWVWDSNPNSSWFGSFIPGPWGGIETVREILAVLQYDATINGGMPPESDRLYGEKFQTNGSLPYYNYLTVNNPDLKAVFNPGQFAFYTAPTVEHHRISSYYSYTATSLEATDSNRSCYINGIMFPNYQLALNLAEGIVDITDTGIPVVFARPHVPVSVSKGQWGLRNLSVWAGFDEYPPMYGGFGNYTQATYIEGNQINLLYIQNPGPMIHPLHLHGNSFALLSSGRTSLEAATMMAEKKKEFGCCRPTNNLLKRDYNGAFYYDNWSSKWYDPVLSEWTDALPNSSYVNASLIIPSVAQRYSDVAPILEDPYGSGEVQLDSPMIIDTVAVPPHGWALIQFISDNPGAWFFHCHIEFHAGGGMGFVYLNDPDSWSKIYPTNKEVQAGFKQYKNGVGADYCCADVEFLGPNQYW